MKSHQKHNEKQDPQSTHVSLKWIASNLYKMQPYGTYYAIYKKHGKQFRESLKTKDRKLAERNLRDILKKAERLRSGGEKLTFRDVAEQFTSSVLAAADIKTSTREYYRFCIQGIQNSWDGLAHKKLRDVTEKNCEEWFAKRKPQVDAQRLNNELGILKRICMFAQREGVILHNPAESLGRVRIEREEPVIPSREQFVTLIAKLRENKNHDAADFVELLAYSGMRRNEAAALKWRDVDGRNFRVTGGKARSKNRKIRHLPLFPNMRELLLRIHRERGGRTNPDDTIMLIKQCRDGISNACEDAGLPHFGHHSMRHCFATNAIEEGIDFKTIAEWLGHSDGGVLVAKVYGHLRKPHSDAMAERMIFTAKVEANQPDQSQQESENDGSVIENINAFPPASHEDTVQSQLAV